MTKKDYVLADLERGNKEMRRTVADIPILTGDHDISLVVKDHNHGNHGCRLS